jgi:hypothetical protein
MSQELPLNALQRRLLSVPETLDCFVGGGRGGGKSFSLALLALAHAERYGRQARILYLRKSYRGLADFELVTRELFATVYGADAKYNGSEHVWKLPGGAYFELGQLESAGDYAKYQGRSFSLLLIDEVGQFADPQLLDMLRSNLRAPRGVPVRMVLAANPGGIGHAWLAARYVFAGAAPWQPFREERSRRDFVYAPSVYTENEFLDRESYREQLEAACADDDELLRAWTEGDWSVVRGAFFASCLSEDRNAVDPWHSIPDDWGTFVSHDFGSAAPSVTYVCARSPGEEVGGRFYPRNSIVLVDEFATHRKGQLNVGTGWTAAQTADAIKTMCQRWKVPPYGAADDACFAQHGHAGGSIADEFAKAGVHFEPAKKRGRVAGWQIMRRVLANAGRPDKAGLYVSRACAYFWATVPYLARDDRRIEDVDSDGPDHAADACRYACTAVHYARDFRFGWAH